MSERSLKPGTFDAGWLKDPTRSVDIEIGSSEGQFLVGYAAVHPAKRYIGIEINPERHQEAVDRAANAGLTNICFVRADATTFIPNNFPPDSVDEYHIYFPTREYAADDGFRRPIATAKFAKDLYTSLRRGGSLRVLTDQPDLFSSFCEVLSPLGFWPRPWRRLPLPIPSGYFAATPLETRYKQTTPILSLRLVK